MEKKTLCQRRLNMIIKFLFPNEENQRMSILGEKDVLLANRNIYTLNSFQLLSPISTQIIIAKNNNKNQMNILIKKS
jgi:hypothetical protein